ncbi:hypothetical protein PVK06_006575 [Gossypium arboreum]|uniref:RNase H type-1 domain-containing protein n=1 Tax=Gossypium arboreum TaxID=29729 RepID=A0ABR0QG93_GOSAR|nr:hypothetical protein PVK06_006575 [Gossypium arboreum]
MGGVCLWKPHIHDALIAEAIVSTQAIRFAQEMGFRFVEIEGDSSLVIKKLEEICIDRSVISNIICGVKMN